MQRRDFLQLSSKSLSVLALNQFLNLEKVLAAVDMGTSAERFFVEIHMGGGWDVTLGTDPWTLPTKPQDSDLFIEYDPSSIVTAAGIPFGPAMMALIPYANNMSLINGVFLSKNDNGHPGAVQYMLTGSTQNMWGALTVELSQCQEESYFGVLNSQGVISGNRSQRTTSLYSIQYASDQPEPIFHSSGSGSSHLDKVREIMNQDSYKVTAYKKLIADLKATEPEPTNHHYLAAAFAAGLSKTCSYSSSGDFLDTHSGHVKTHLNSQTKHWADVAAMLKAFKQIPYGTNGESVFDRTTFYVTSEFSRTAALNQAGGKDHNPILNSVLIIDSRVKAGVIGGSHLVTARESSTGSSYHIASPIYYTTGRKLSSKENAFIIRPENVAATVVELMGVSRKRFASVGPKTASLTHLVL